MDSGHRVPAQYTPMQIVNEFDGKPHALEQPERGCGASV
jgi:hypothetical protein